MLNFYPIRRPIDGSLFGAIDVMAKSVVSKIAEILTDKPAVTESTKGDSETPKITGIKGTNADINKKDEKIVLTTAKWAVSG